MQNLSPTTSTDYSLWKAVKRIKHIPSSFPPLQTAQGTWARTNIAKAHAFANHLASVFQPHHTNLPDEEELLVRLLQSRYQLEPPLHRFKQTEIQSSTAFHPKLPLATASSWVKSSKNYLLLTSNTSPNFSMLPSSSDTSPINGKLLKSSSF
jgi:hypothetical protein